MLRPKDPASPVWPAAVSRAPIEVGTDQWLSVAIELVEVDGRLRSRLHRAPEARHAVSSLLTALVMALRRRSRGGKACPDVWEFSEAGSFVGGQDDPVGGAGCGCDDEVVRTPLAAGALNMGQ